MLEALIRITDPPNNSKVKARGDVVAVKLKGAVWGLLEKKRFVVVELVDAALETKLLAMAAKGEPHPVITNPYAEFEDFADPEIEPVLLLQSKKKLDIALLDPQTQADLLNLTKEKPILKAVVIKEKLESEKPPKPIKPPKLPK